MSSTSQDSDRTSTKKPNIRKNKVGSPQNDIPLKPKLPPVVVKRFKPPPTDISDSISDITMSDYHESMRTSKSDLQQSYRDKLRDRFLSVKRQSQKSLIENEKQKSGSASSMRSSVELIQKKNSEINKQMERYKKPLIEEKGISRAEKYHFFCESDGDPESIKEDVAAVVNRKAESIINEVVQAEYESTWYVSSKRTQSSELKENISDEGIYIPEPPKVSTRHLSLLQQRLSTDDNSKFLDANQKILFSEHPYSKTSFRPENYHTRSQLETEYCKASAESAEFLQSVVISGNQLLEINVQSVKFGHHPLFSEEHVLQEKLVELYDVHRNFMVNGKRERLEKQLNAARMAKDKEETDFQGDRLDEEGDFYTSVRRVKKLRQELFEEYRAYRENVKDIINVWRLIKKIREKNKLSNTSIKLVIRKEPADVGKEKTEHQEQFQQIYAEILNEEKLEYDLKKSDYKKELAKWREENDGDITTAKPSKPTKHFSEDTILSNLKLTFLDCFKQPGEPDLYFSISYDNAITRVIDDAKEKSRRAAVTATKLFLKFFCNNVQVCKTNRRKFNDDFACIFDESFSLQLVNVPDVIEIELWQQSGPITKSKLAALEIKIPSKTSGQSRVDEIGFTNSDACEYNHTAVGCGVKIKDITDFDSKDVLQTRGCLISVVRWNISDETLQENPHQNSLLDENGVIDVDKLNDWIDDANLDPQDPRNADIFDYLNNYKEQSTKPKTEAAFRLDPHLSSFTICTRKDLDDNVRFKLLELRDKNEPEFAGMVVPNRLKEIPTNIFSAYNRRLAQENLDEYFQEDDFENEINSRRSYGRKYLRQIHTKVFQLCRNAKNNLSFEDVVNEESISLIETYIKTMLSNIINWFRFHPLISKPLPVKQLYETETMQIIENMSPPKIVIKLVGALNVPMRKSTTNRRKSSNAQTASSRPFVEVTYQDLKMQTSTGEGRHPAWNEELKLPLETMNTDYLSPSSLSGSICLSIFDEFDDDTSNCLGSVQVPLSAICQNKLEGMFLVQTTPILMRHVQAHEMEQPNKQSNAPIHSNWTYLNMKISVEPSIPKLSPDMQSLPCSEPPFLRSHILEWDAKHNVEHPRRKFSALAIDTNGKTVCTTRFIKALEPPQINADGFDVSADQCARYISLIPFTDCNNFYQNIWLSTEQLLKLGLGSIVDHAVALTCYFLALKLDVWLLLGSGIPHGNAAYVLVREYVQDAPLPLHFIYDVVTGLKYNVLDLYCPLQRIFCVINDSNIWVNNQRGDCICATRFDFSRRFDWSPLFTNQVSAPTSSVQQKLLYISNYDVQQLQLAIERKLRKKIAKMRVHDRTIWNHYLSATLKKSMAKYEMNVMHGKTQFDNAPEMQEFVNYEMNGCVVNKPFASIASIVDNLISLRFLRDSNVEFASAVSIFPYPNQILSVWVALVSINRTD